MVILKMLNHLTFLLLTVELFRCVVHILVLSQTVIVDNSPYSYAFHPQNAFPISSFIDNPNDNELLNAIPYLRELARTKDVVEFLKKSRGCMPRQSYFSRKEIEEPAYDRVGNAIVP